MLSYLDASRLDIARLRTDPSELLLLGLEPGKQRRRLWLVVCWRLVEFVPQGHPLVDDLLELCDIGLLEAVRVAQRQEILGHRVVQYALANGSLHFLEVHFLCCVLVIAVFKVWAGIGLGIGLVAFSAFRMVANVGPPRLVRAPAVLAGRHF